MIKQAKRGNSSTERQLEQKDPTQAKTGNTSKKRQLKQRDLLQQRQATEARRSNSQTSLVVMLGLTGSVFHRMLSRRASVKAILRKPWTSPSVGS